MNGCKYECDSGEDEYFEVEENEPEITCNKCKYNIPIEPPPILDKV